MIGLYCAVVKKNMVKIALGILIMEYAVNLFLILLGYRKGGIAPIVVDREDIFASVGSLALMISICIRVYNKYGTFDITQIRRLKG
jgi:multicomponent Na+:H+ antiporter subunit C